MTIALPFIARGRHKPGVVNARLRSENRELKADKRQLATNAYRHEDEIHTALLRGCQDAILIAQLRTERDGLAATVTRMDEQHGQTVRALERQAAELARRLELRSLTEAVVTKTQELSVEEIQRHCTTPVLPLHQSPLNNPAAPTHVPSWAVRDETATT